MDERIIHIKSDIEIKKIDGEIRTVDLSPNPAVVQHDTHVVHALGCEKTILKTSYRGPQGPKGDTATFNDLTIPDLTARFNGGLL